MDERKLKILLAIAESFIQSASPIGSQNIVGRYNFNVSSATVRNDMANLEEEAFIYQPHTSAGRVPTTKGYRFLFDYFRSAEADQVAAQQEFDRQYRIHLRQKSREKIYDAVSLLAQVTGNVSVATLPDNQQTIYLGLANVLRQPEFFANPAVASQVIEVLEQDFISLLEKIEFEDGGEVEVFIGEENLINQFQSCTLMVSRYRLNHGESGFFGILGPTRMKYAYNYTAIKSVRKVLES